MPMIKQNLGDGLLHTKEEWADKLRSKEDVEKYGVKVVSTVRSNGINEKRITYIPIPIPPTHEEMQKNKSLETTGIVSPYRTPGDNGKTEPEEIIFMLGDFVKYKHPNSPVMRVTIGHNTKFITCTWFCENKTLQRAEFPSVHLFYAGPCHRCTGHSVIRDNGKETKIYHEKWCENKEIK